jgi:NTE family protein
VSAGRRISLVLGAGGARGYAHIGAVQVLQERGHEIVAISGCSMGALIGGMHAAGQLEAFTEWALTLRQREVLRLLDFSLSGPSILRAERVLARVGELVDGQLIEDLPIPFTAVATDLVAQREVWFQTGPLEDAIRASIALPGILPPVIAGDQVLVDGGLLNAIPVAPTHATPADLTVAVALGGERRSGRAVGLPPVRERAPGTAAGVLEEWMGRMRRSTGNGTSGADAPTARGAGYPDDLTRVGIMNAAVETMQAAVSRHRLAGSPPDVLVEVSRDACRTLDFHRAGELIEIGRTLTEQALDDLAAREA